MLGITIYGRHHVIDIHVVAAIKCDEPSNVTNTDVTIIGVHYSLSVHYDCSFGYAMYESTNSPDQERQTMTCQANGTWDTTPDPCPHSASRRLLSEMIVGLNCLSIVALVFQGRSVMCWTWAMPVRTPLTSNLRRLYTLPVAKAMSRTV